MKRESMVIYRSQFEGLMDLPKSRRLDFFEAMLRYGLDGEVPKLHGAEMAFFRQIMAAVDGNNKRFVNGKRGGAPAGNKNASKNNQKQPVVESKTTSGCNQNNQYIYDEDVYEDVYEDVDVLSGKPDDLPADRIILYLNRKAHRAYQRTEKNRALVDGILVDYPETVVKAVIDNKVAQWADDPKMVQYLRPSTLFNPDRFDEYANEDWVADEDGGEAV